MDVKKERRILYRRGSDRQQIWPQRRKKDIDNSTRRKSKQEEENDMGELNNE